MERIPSIGLVEILILSVVAGLVLLIGVGILVVLAKKRRGSGTQPSGVEGSGAATSRSRNLWIWIAVFVLLGLVGLPLCVVASGILLATPVRQVTVMDQGPGPQIQVGEMAAPDATRAPAVAMPGTAPTLTPWTAPTPGAQPTPILTGSSGSLSLDPFNPTAFVILLGLAGLVLLLGVAVVAAVGKGWPGADETSSDVELSGEGGDAWARTAKLRYVLLALVFWVALSVFLVLDLAFSVSLYWQFVVMYAAFWVLVGLLLASGRSKRDRLLILGLFVVVLISIRFVDWNSRKPFLRDLNRVEEGMSPSQVEQIMGVYMQGGGRPLESDGKDLLNEQGEVIAGTVTYRHTNEGWGDSDWGVVTYENGRVVKVEFLPD